MGLADRLKARQARLLGGRKAWSEPLSWEQDALRFPLLSWTTLKPNEESIENDFEGYISSVYKADGVVFACIRTRAHVFSEARFQWRRFRNGRPGELFGDPNLSLLENPWPGGTTRELLARMEVTASLAGSYYGTVADDKGRLGRSATGPGRRIVHMRPDWTKIIIESATKNPYALDARVVGYLYEARSPSGEKLKPVFLLANEVCHYSPEPDPGARFRGMSWLTPVLREIMSDKAATKHKLKFFENGASLQTVISLKESVSPENFQAFVQRFKAEQEGVDNAYKTLFVGGGADVTAVGADLKSIDFKSVQGAGETRIAAAAGAHPVVVGLSEGMAGSALNAGNFKQAKRNFVEGTMRHLWGTAAASLQVLLDPDEGAALWFDDRDIPYLRDDEAELAAIRQKDAMTLRALADAGADWDAGVEYIDTGDVTRLKGKHSGLFSVQLQPPGTGQAGESAPSDETEDVTVTDPETANKLITAGWKVRKLRKPPELAAVVPPNDPPSEES